MPKPLWDYHHNKLGDVASVDLRAKKRLLHGIVADGFDFNHIALQLKPEEIMTEV